MTTVAPSREKAAIFGPTGAWLRYLGWIAAALLTLAFAIVPDLVTLPEPAGALTLSRATFVNEDAQSAEVALPHAAFKQMHQTGNPVHYLIEFNLAAPQKNLFLFIPAVNRRISLSLNGEKFIGFDSNSFWTGPLAPAAMIAGLPQVALIAGRNTITVEIESTNVFFPIYLSQIYVGDEVALASAFKKRTFFAIELKAMAIMANVLLALGVIFAYFCRRHDRLFAWLAAMMALTLITTDYVIFGFQSAIRNSLVVTSCFTPAVGLMYIGVAIAVVDRQPPRILRTLAIAITCILLLIVALYGLDSRTIIAGVAIFMLIVTRVIGLAILAWGALRHSSIDARLMLVPYFLQAWCAIRDIYVFATVPEHGFNLLIPYTRPVVLLFIIAVLMRRMSASLEGLDRSNENLAAKLSAQQAELAVFHRQERLEATRLTRERERQRLTYDLHDGLSGHLASIIALSEKSHDRPIEEAARDALSDLRLVIYSLDLGDRELPLALANFRDRLVPQLNRLGITLDWSIAGLPEVSGVTPGNALAVLRILQEAINNALKHGPARRLVIRGAASADGMAQITLENDGQAFVENDGGHGLRNMRRRTEQLHGQLTVEAVATGTKLTLRLPLELPVLEDEAVA